MNATECHNRQTGCHNTNPVTDRYMRAPTYSRRFIQQQRCCVLHPPRHFLFFLRDLLVVHRSLQNTRCCPRADVLLVRVLLDEFPCLCRMLNSTECFKPHTLLFINRVVILCFSIVSLCLSCFHARMYSPVFMHACVALFSRGIVFLHVV